MCGGEADTWRCRSIHPSRGNCSWRSALRSDPGLAVDKQDHQHHHGLDSPPAPPLHRLSRPPVHSSHAAHGKVYDGCLAAEDAYQVGRSALYTSRPWARLTRIEYPSTTTAGKRPTAATPRMKPSVTRCEHRLQRPPGSACHLRQARTAPTLPPKARMACPTSPALQSRQASVSCRCWPISKSG